MNTYLFKTTATMKECNNKKWWIDSDVVREIEIEAENVNTALKGIPEGSNRKVWY